mmetsp:Transcript_39137/g.120956  ORF Transcript_39137/g.120956 Transcript_39137/m.120956 type:complete len:271 (-) Transcript_39137:230-1042(-)
MRSHLKASWSNRAAGESSRRQRQMIPALPPRPTPEKQNALLFLPPKLLQQNSPTVRPRFGAHTESCTALSVDGWTLHHRHPRDIRIIRKNASSMDPTATICEARGGILPEFPAVRWPQQWRSTSVCWLITTAGPTPLITLPLVCSQRLKSTPSTLSQPPSRQRELCPTALHRGKTKKRRRQCHGRRATPLWVAFKPRNIAIRPPPLPRSTEHARQVARTNRTANPVNLPQTSRQPSRRSAVHLLRTTRERILVLGLQRVAEVANLRSEPT